MRHAPFVVLVGLIVSSSALAQSETQPACALRQPGSPRTSGHGTILGFQDPADARAGIPAREAQRGGAIDPHYLADLRVLVKQDDGIVDYFDVPEGVTAHVGDRVRLQGSYRSPTSTCSYIPHLAIPNDAPAV